MAAQINFSDIFSELKLNLKSLAETTLKKYVSEAKKDGQKLLDLLKEDLERWTKLLANGDITTKDFEWLVNSERASVKMAALENAGLALIRVDQFRNSVLNLVVDTVFSTLKI